jgi:hypothetical protein
VVTPTGSVHQCNILSNGEYAWYVSTPNYPVTILDATDNWWGTADSAAIEALIYHHIDDTSHPTVDYIPCAAGPFEFSDSTVTDTAAHH